MKKVEVKHIYLEEIMAAHSLCNLGHSLLHFTLLYLSALPCNICDLIVKDSKGGRYHKVFM